MILALVAMVLTLILVIGLHEAGHALAAKLFNVKIQRIAIGFGKPLFQWTDKQGREWVWGIWPLGGYVSLLNSRITAVNSEDLIDCFDKKPIGVRCVILVSGALANLLTALLALTFMFMLGYHRDKPVVQTVMPQSVAARAGLTEGDEFVSVGHWKTSSWQEVGMSFIRSFGQAELDALVMNASGSLRLIHFNLSQWHYKKQDRSLFRAMGIKPLISQKQHIKGQPFLMAVQQAMSKLLQLLSFFLDMLKQLILARIPLFLLLGPLGLFAASIGSFLQGMAVFLYFIASLSLAVGLINLLPIPGLDGGSMMYALIEGYRGKPMSVALEILLYRFAKIILGLLLIQLLMNDLERALLL